MEPGDTQPRPLARRDGHRVAARRAERPGGLQASQVEAVVRVAALEHFLTLATPRERERLDLADRAAQREGGLQVQLARARATLAEQAGGVLSADDQRGAEAIVQVEAADVDPLGAGAVGRARAPGVPEQRVGAARRETDPALVLLQLDPRSPEAGPQHRQGAVRPAGRLGGRRIGPRRGPLVDERRGRLRVRQLERRDPHVVAARGVVGEGDRAAVRADRGLEGAAEDVRHAQELAVGEPQRVQVRCAVAVGAEHDRLPVGRPGGLDVLGAVVSQLLDGTRHGVDEHQVQPAARQQARRHDRGAGRAEARPAPLDTGGRGGESAQAPAVDADEAQLGTIAELAGEHDRCGRRETRRGRRPAPRA